MSFLENSDFRDVANHMLWLGRGALRQANWCSSYFSWENPVLSQLSVLQAAHAAEIFIKAKIAEEHPLLIFDSLPKAKADGREMSIDHLLEEGRTVQWSDLPNRLWATTGKSLPSPKFFKEFGKIRNAIQHFAAPFEDAALKASQFIYQVIDPFINENWGLYAVDHNEDGEAYLYLVNTLVANQIEFLVSPECALEYKDKDPNFLEENHYAALMRDRIRAAIAV